MNKILCIGEALIDMICTDKGESIDKGQHFLKKPGGAPTNVAAAIGAFGGSVDLVAKVGNDPFGLQLTNVLNDFGVNTKWLIKDNDFFTTMAFVSLMQNGERDFVFNRGADGQLNVADIKDIDIEEYKIIHFGSATAFLDGPLNNTYKNVLEQAVKQNKFISFDPNYRDLLFKNDIENFVTQSWEFISHSNFFKVSDEEALLITNSNNVIEAAQILLKKSTAIFAITIGKEGTILGFQQQLFTIESIEINPIDTTGAGDSFVGAVLYQLANVQKNEIENLGEIEWKNIIKNANIAGARTCEHFGAMEAFKKMENIFK